MRHLGLVLAFLVACNGSDTSGNGECNTDNEECGLGQNCGGEDINMAPGSDCMACHDGSDNEAPAWTIAGTVFDDLNGSNAVSGATVRITDTDGAGTPIEMTTSAAGNFTSTAAIVAPYTAEIEVDGVVVAMAAHQTDGSCNSCHACGGSAGGKLHTP